MSRQNGFAIRAFRQKAGYTVREMADRLPHEQYADSRISLAHYRKIEDETREAGPRQLQALAVAFDVPVAALVRTPPGGVGGSVSAGRETVRA
jgi:transcriptional regulator with XRE-family HTH domain